VILIVSNARDATADFLQERMNQTGVKFIRLNTECLPGIRFCAAPKAGLVDGGFTIGEERFQFADLKSVYYRRPIAPSVDGDFSPGLRAWIQNENRRSWGGLLLSLQKLRWVNHPLAISAASYKPEQLVRAHRFGLSVPETLITTEPNEARSFCKSHDWNVVAKPLGHGEIRGSGNETDKLVYTSALRPEIDDEFAAVVNCPTLFQVRVNKIIDIRATVIDSRCLGVALHSQERPESMVDCRRNNMIGMRYSRIDLPDTLVDALVELTRSYSLHFAAIDLARDVDGSYWFFELNPAGQWAWLEQKTDVPIAAALIASLTGDTNFV